jgi:peptidoglycan hydrolase-like protein with peptidoglycan-binding domain
VLISAILATPASAGDDFVGGLMGAMIGAAIANSGNANTTKQKTTKRQASRPSISTAQRAENKGIQEALNYFGFNAGKPDGVLGRKTTQAVSQMQACLGIKSPVS